MKLATSRITKQGQISIPAAIRRRLGLVPGSVLEWESEGENVVVRRAGKFSSLDIHRAIFGKDAPAPKTLDQMDEAIGEHLREKHARN